MRGADAGRGCGARAGFVVDCMFFLDLALEGGRSGWSRCTKIISFNVKSIADRQKPKR